MGHARVVQDPNRERVLVCLDLRRYPIACVVDLTRMLLQVHNVVDPVHRHVWWAAPVKRSCREPRELPHRHAPPPPQLLHLPMLTVCKCARSADEDDVPTRAQLVTHVD
eukprot:6530960-Prymnesium_polylepis.1